MKAARIAACIVLAAPVGFVASTALTTLWYWKVYAPRMAGEE